MPSAADRIDFGPPRDAGRLRALGLALLAHGLLIAALTWGVHWKSTDRSVSFDAELWSAVPQQAAPKPAEPPPPPPTPEAVKPEPATPPTPDVDIALEQEKKRKLKQLKDAEELAQKEKEKARADKLKDDLAKRKAADDAKKLEARQQQLKEQSSTTALAEQRKQNLARVMGLAGASGAEDAKGGALQSSGPSASYGGRVRAKVKPNIIFTDEIQGNASAEVEVRSAPNGSVISQKLVKSSGNKAWDDAVIKAIIKTETMPRDVDGRVPSPMILSFTPRD